MLWAIVAVWGGVVNLATVVVSWRGRVSYQRAGGTGCGGGAGPGRGRRRA
jgi:hypothetical protein